MRSSRVSEQFQRLLRMAANSLRSLPEDLEMPSETQAEISYTAS